MMAGWRPHSSNANHTHCVRNQAEMRLPFSLVLFIIAHSSEGAILIKEFYDDLSPQACAA
jgi:hypothetical protein